jgi:hypothetical protein
MMSGMARGTVKLETRMNCTDRGRKKRGRSFRKISNPACLRYWRVIEVGLGRLLWCVRMP